MYMVNEGLDLVERERAKNRKMKAELEAAKEKVEAANALRVAREADALEQQGACLAQALYHPPGASFVSSL